MKKILAKIFLIVLVLVSIFLALENHEDINNNDLNKANVTKNITDGKLIELQEVESFEETESIQPIEDNSEEIFITNKSYSGPIENLDE